jgi:hypothetical protein
MPRPNRFGDEPAAPGPALPPMGSVADFESLDRLADMIADGRLPFPTDAPAPDRDRLLALVRARLRDRLLALVARAVARDIRGGNTE